MNLLSNNYKNEKYIPSVNVSSSEEGRHLFDDHLRLAPKSTLCPGNRIQIIFQILDLGLPKTELKEGCDFFLVPFFVGGKQGTELLALLVPSLSHVLPQNSHDGPLEAKHFMQMHEVETVEDDHHPVMTFVDTNCRNCPISCKANPVLFIIVSVSILGNDQGFERNADMVQHIAISECTFPNNLDVPIQLYDP